MLTFYDELELAARPLLFVAVSTTILILAVGFTPAYSFLRSAGVLPVAALAVLSFNACRCRTGVPQNVGFLCCLPYELLMQYIEVVLLSRWTFEAQGPTPAPPADPTHKGPPPPARGGLAAPQRIGQHAAFSKRACGTPHEAKNVPPFRAADPLWAPPRSAFLARTALWAVAFQLLFDVQSTLDDPDAAAARFAPSRVPYFSRWHEVSREETITRLVFAPAFWSLGAVSITLMVAPFALAWVGLGGSEPKNWKPIFGSPADAYTVRRFWGYASLPLDCVIQAHSPCRATSKLSIRNVGRVSESLTN